MYLDKILDFKRQEIKVFKERCSCADFEKMFGLQKRQGDFKKAFLGSGTHIIAEVKKASPSRGVICGEFDPVGIAREYEKAGASAISVLTDENFFKGSVSYLREIRKITDLPLLRKDFIVDEIQIFEAKALGADACLLIVAALSLKKLYDLIKVCRSLGVDALVEVHSREEVKVAVDAGAEIIGVNNRNLQTFKLDLGISLDVVSEIPSNCIKISESGIESGEDVRRLKEAGFQGFLIGSSLMSAPNRKLLFEELLR